MSDFLRIAQGIDMMPLLSAVMRQPTLWNANTTRTHHSQSAHRIIDDILLRYNRFDPTGDFVDQVCSRIEAVNQPAWSLLPQATDLVFGLMARLQGEHLGRVFISRMRPGTSIPLHTDRIPPAEAAFPDRLPPALYYERYQLPLQSRPGVMFEVNGQVMPMQVGECWWFRNDLPHTVINNSDADRISLIVDIRPFSPCH